MPLTPTMNPEFRPGRNRTGATIGRYLLMKADTANMPDGITATTADTDVPVGVTAANVPDGTNGDLCVRGRHPVTASGAIASGARIAPDAGGKVKAAAAGDAVIGHAVDAAAADNDIIAAELNIPGSVW
ncbi:MAG: capsid cement protein [Myxococcota bacterium]